MATRLLIAFALGMATAACQTVMSVEDARRVTAQFAGRSFVPPPRTVNDITIILDRQQRIESEALIKARALVDQPAPATGDAEQLANFYYARAMAAREVGRFRQELEDLSHASDHSRRMEILSALSEAYYLGGNLSRAKAIREEMLQRSEKSLAGWHIHDHAFLSRLSANAGDLEAAESSLLESMRLLSESRGWQNQRLTWLVGYELAVVSARASLLDARGRYTEAEAFRRESIAIAASDSRWSHLWLETVIKALAENLLRQDRLLEAESEARKAVFSALRKRGRNSVVTASALKTLGRVLVAQGRYAEAEIIARVAVDIFVQVGVSSDSHEMTLARREVASALVGQRRWEAAAAQFDATARMSVGDDIGFGRALNYYEPVVDEAIALLRVGRPGDAARRLFRIVERARAALGEAHPRTAEARALLAAAHAALGERRLALTEFAEAARVLLDRTLPVRDEMIEPAAREQRFRVILDSYVSLLASIRGTPDERDVIFDAASEAFRLADLARRSSTQRSIDAAAARAAAKTPALADLVRREQDARRQIAALSRALANTMASPLPSERNAAVLRGELETLRRARLAIRRQIDDQFPSYAQLINPDAMTVEQARRLLHAGEALISIYVNDDQTFVWAVPHSGTVAFVAAPLGRESLDKRVAALRTALAPEAKTLEQIPVFDLAAAHDLFSALLEPVADGWRRADSLLIVADGALGQLPFGLLPTRTATLRDERGVRFADYQAVPWLIRSHAITVLPSVTALATLRTSPPGERNRLPFVGFGDPVFNREQVTRALDEPGSDRLAMAVTARGPSFMLRSSQRTRAVDGRRLAMLPRLPDTADEIRSIASVLNADPTRDVFVGARANERTVKSLDLTAYRVLAFATHGLMPGELDGLTQPALALSAPDVADPDGDGLLTMEEILGLRLDADWVVLSACNTAGGADTGGDSISGLGHAFFYAGARALLLSNWPVETTSARALTTDVFRRQNETPGLTRAKALQATMISLIDGPGFVDDATNTPIFSYAHPIFWAPFTLVGDGG